VRSDVVEHIDLAASSLALAGITRPAAMHARDLFAGDYRPREFVYAARDRADETVDLIRSVRDTRWKYIRNGFPGRPYLQPNNYKDSKAIVQAMRRLHGEGKLTPEQSLIMAESRPREELYDTESDPFELKNLAGDPAQTARIERMRAALTEWQKQTGDPFQPESEEVYRVETGANHAEGGKNADRPQYRANVELMLRWAKEKPPVR
jgi:arylsulfatase A-like enzyme